MNALHTLRKVQPEPAVVKDRNGRTVVIDDAVLAPMRGEIPADEPGQEQRIQIGPLDV